MDLLTPVLPEESWHPNFAALMRCRNTWNEAVLDDWATGFVDRDGNFAKEFQTKFNACFWELYLNAILRDRGLSVDFGYSSPDFVVASPHSFTIEATIACHAQGHLPEHSPLTQAQVPDDLNALNREAILRLSNALQRKHEKYKTHYAGQTHVSGKPFVIALAPFDRPFFYLSCQRAIEAVLFNYYVDEEAYISAGKFDSPIPKETVLSVIKDSGANVELGLFQNDSMPEVSAVVFSTCATLGKVSALSSDPNPNIYFTAFRYNPRSSKPHVIRVRKDEYAETLLDGLRVYHNPNATHPLDPAVFRSAEVFQAYYCHQSGEWVYEIVEGQLLIRQTMTLLPKVHGTETK